MKHFTKLIVVLVCCIVIYLIYKYRQFIFKPNNLQPLVRYGEELSPKPQTYAIVISRFNENMDWLISKNMLLYLKNIHIYSPNANINLYLYLKSDEPLNISTYILEKYYNNVYIEKLKNVGMCAQTYLYHIFKNYNKLEDVIFFIPGSAANNIKINLLNSLMNHGYKYSYYFTYVRKEYFLPYYQSSGYIVTEEKNQTKENSNFEISDIRPFGKWYEHYTNKELSTYDTNHKDIFSLSKETIRKLPLNFYETMEKLLSQHVNPEDCHYVERMWYPFFST